MGSSLRRFPGHNSTLTNMKTLVFLVGCGLSLGSPLVLDTPEVVEAKEKFTAAFRAAELGEHAKLAPVNTDVQEAAPVFTGEQIPEAFLAETPEVAEAKASFSSAFDEAAAGGLAAKQAPAPALPQVAPVPALKSALAAPTVYAHTYPH